MITRHQTHLGERLTRRISSRILDERGLLKSGYVLLIGLFIGFMIGASL